MSSFLRTAQIFRSLRSIASIFHLAARPQRAICHVKPSPAFLARCLSVQPTSQLNRPVFHNELDNLLHKLDNDGHRFGNISVSLVHKIHAMVQKNSDISPSQALLVLRCCGNLMPEELPAARTQLALDFWSTLESKGVPFDMSHYNALLRVYLENEHNFSPLDFLSRLQENGLEPNRITYQRLVARYAQVGDIEGASKILEFMKEKNIAINETIFNSLILGHARANDLPSAVDLLEVMRNSGLEPSIDTYSALAVAQAEKGDLDGIKSTVALSKENRQALNDRDLLEVVYALAVSGHKDFVPEVMSMIQKDWGYNMDCKNIIYRLLNAGCDAEARQAYATMETYAEPNSQSNLNNGYFFVKHLILRDRPASTVVGLCEELSGNSPHMLLRALEVAVFNNVNLASPIMDALLSKGEVLRPHYFWPLLAQCSAKRDPQGICAVLENMKSREVPISTQTLVDYALPCLLEGEGTGSSGLVRAILRLRDAGVHIRDCVNAAVKYSLIKNDLKSAAEILRQFVYSLSPQLRRQLVTALCHTAAYEEAAIVLMQIVRSRRTQQEAQEGGMDEEAAVLDEEVLAPLHEDKDLHRDEDDVVGRALLDLAFKLTSDKFSIDMATFLRALLQRGLSINRQSEAAIAHRLGALATPEVNALLDTLASGTLSLVQLERGSRRDYPTLQSISELEARLEEHLAQDKDTKQVLTNLLVAYTKAKNVEKSEEILQKLQDMQIPIGMGLDVLMMDMYCASNLPQKALDLFNSIHSREPDTVLLPSKCLKVARSLVEDGRVDEAIDVMNLWGKHGASDAATPDDQQDVKEADLDRASPQIPNDGFIDMTCSMMLLPLGDKGELETVQRLVDAILRNKLAHPSRQLFAPIVNAHLAKDDVEGAMATLSRFCKEHKLLPSKQQVLCALIKREDTDKLRQLVDMGTEIHGEGNSLLDLALAFIDEGRYNEARRIFETPGLRISQNRLNYLCGSLGRQNKVKSLEALLRATVPLFGVDRKILYLQALQAYIAVGDCDNALGLWTQMQGEDVNITDQFLYKLGQFLRENDREVPFALPAAPATQPSTVASPSDRKRDNSAAVLLPLKTLAEKRAQTEEQFPLLKQYRAIIKTSPVDEVLAHHSKLTDDPSLRLFAADTANLVERLLDEKRLTDAIDVVKRVKDFRGRSFIRHHAMRRFLAQLAVAGDFDAILYFMTQSPVSERYVFGQSLCKAASQSNRVQECLALFEKNVQEADTSSPEGLRNCSSSFPKPGILALLNKDESLLPKIEDLAEKYKAKGMFSGSATLWAYHFAKQDTEKANQLKQELKAAGYQLPHAALCGLMRDTGDLSLAPRILQEIQDSPGPSLLEASGAVHSAWIDVHCLKQQPKQGLQVLDSFLQRGNISSINRGTLVGLTASLANENIPFPYTIPGQTKNPKPESSSSSDSD